MSLENVQKSSAPTESASVSKSARPEVSGTLIKRWQTSDTIRGLDLAVSVKPKLTGVSIKSGPEHVAKFESTISMGQMDRSRLNGFKAFSPIGALKKTEPGSKADRAMMNKSLNEVTNKVVKMPTETISKESQMSAVFSKKLGGVVTGLIKTGTPEAMKVVKDLTGDNGVLLGSKEIRVMLKSSDPGIKEKGMNALKALNSICNNPTLLTTAVANSPHFSENITAHSLDPLQVQTVFIKESRAIISDIFFQSTITEGLDKVTIPDVVLPERSLSDYSANVGFNRLMSPNNMLGASHSSDVDFKLVLDDVTLKTDLAVANPTFSDAQLNKAVDDIKKSMKGVLDGAKGVMEGEFALTLEVADFTVKTISGIKEQIANPKTSEIEQNFLATVLHNHSFMSGNDKVMGQFVDIIKDSLQFSKVATRNFDQYLGDSDKGSIKAIKNLPQMESLVNMSSDIITSEPALLDAAIEHLHLHVMENKPTAQEVKQLLRDDPVLLKKAMALPAIKDAILADPRVTTGLGLVDMFGEAAPDKKLELSFKLVSSFTKQIEGETNRDFIGKPGVKPDDNWMFSVKYSGCRLNDFFDSTPKSVYVLSSNNVAQAEKKYDAVQSIAEPINSFAIQIQNRTYELAKIKDPSISHDDIDQLYDRVTGNEFAQMLADPVMLPKMKTMIDNLVSELDKGNPQAKTIMGEGNLAKLKEFQTAISGDLSSHTPAQMRELGHTLFNTVSTITDNASSSLQPEKPKVRSLHSQTV